MIQYSARFLITAKAQSNKSQIISILGRKDLNLYIIDKEVSGNY